MREVSCITLKIQTLHFDSDFITLKTSEGLAALEDRDGDFVSKSQGLGVGVTSALVEKALPPHWFFCCPDSART